MSVPKITLSTKTMPAEGATGSYLITLDTPTPAAGLTVNFNTTGIASPGIDYSFIAAGNITGYMANSFTLAAGVTSAEFTVFALSDAASDPNETIILNLTPGNSYQLVSSGISFAPKIDYAAGSIPVSVGIGNVNSDGKLDLIVTNLGGNTRSVLYQNTATSFDAKVDVAIASLGSFTSNNFGDFNSDGKLDFAVPNYNDNTVSLLVRNAANTGFDKFKFSTGQNPVSVSVGDLNSDGKADIIVANAGGDTVSVLLNNANTSATLTIADVLPINHSPELSGSQAVLSGKEDTAYTFKQSDLLQGFSDADSDTLAIANLTATNGSLNGLVFTPNADYNGAVALSYNVTDGNGGSIAATQNFTLAPVNDTPTGKVTISDTTPQLGQTLTANNTLADVDGMGAITYQWTAAGVAVGKGNSYTVTAAEVGKSIVVTASYTDTPNHVESISSAATTVVPAANHSPELSGPQAVLSGKEDIAYTFKQSDLLQGFSDADNDTLSIANLTATNGTLNGLVFTPNADYNGAVALNYDVTDGKGGSTAATLNFALTAVNDTPVLKGVQAVLTAGQEDSAYTIKASDLLQGVSDVDNDTLAIANLTATNGSLNGLVFTPNADYNGAVALSYNVTDGKGGSIVAKQNFTLAPVNDAPTGKVTISDTTPQLEQILTASNTLADVDGMGTITYQWTAAGAVIGKGDSYTVTAAEVGKSIAVTASYTDTPGHVESINSAATTAVPPPLPGVNLKLSSANSNTSEGNFLVDGTPGDSVTYSVTLSSQPNQGNVVLDFTSSDTTEGTVTPTLTFTSANWNMPQVLTISGVDDMKGADVAEGVIGGNIAEGNIAYTVTAVIDQVLTDALEYKTISIPTISLQNIDDPEDIPINNDSNNNYGADNPAFSNVDYMVGSNLNDQIYAGRGSDEIKAGFGNDLLYGQDGNDVLYGQQGNDTVWGGYQNDTLNGDDGNDTLYGEQDYDVLNGGNGNDYLDGGLGADTLHGNMGNDTYVVDDAADVTEDLGASTDVDTVLVNIPGVASYTLPLGIENAKIQGTGNTGLTGNDANNTLTGNNDNNALIGAVGRDSLFGGSGNDVLSGGAGNDVLSGGTGKDTFKFNTALTDNTDQITDFKPVDDTIQLDNAFFTKLGSNGGLAAGILKIGTAAADGNDYVIYNSNDGALYYDADGNGSGAAVQIGVIGAQLAITSADFVVI